MGARKRLRAALSELTKIRIDLRPEHADRLEGFVVGLGKEWVLLAATMDGGYFDGYQAFRLKDVERIRADKSFQARFSRTQSQWPPSSPPVDLDSTVGVVTSMADWSALIGIEKANERSALWIGTLYEAGRKWVWLHEVAPDGTWGDTPLGYRTNQITNVHSGTHYLTALTTVAGDQPTLTPPDETPPSQ